jgi:hypothetical protein
MERNNAGKLQLKHYIPSKHYYLFLKEISYMFRLKCSHHQADYENKKEDMTAAWVSDLEPKT